jgi:hypothetical protein
MENKLWTEDGNSRIIIAIEATERAKAIESSLDQNLQHFTNYAIQHYYWELLATIWNVGAHGSDSRIFPEF